MDLLHIHRYLANEAPVEERRELESWVEQSEENRKFFESYRKIYRIKIGHKHQYNIEDALYIFRQLMNSDVVPASIAPVHRIERNRKRHVKTAFWIKAAAVAVIALGLSLYFYSTHETFDNKTVKEVASGITIETEPGEQKSFRLSDGTRIKLNASSRVYLPSDFGMSRREVSLQGEAFFEVAHNAELEFIVETEAARVSVLGTSFAIRAWQDRDESVIAVQTGRVAVYSSNPDIHEQTVLGAGEYSQVRFGQAPGPASQANFEQFIGWTNQKFVFEETPLRDVLHQLGLHFNVRIAVKDSASIDDPVTARYRGETLEEILRFTSITHGVTFEVESL
jgi:transmembrane sensor